MSERSQHGTNQNVTDEICEEVVFDNNQRAAEIFGSNNQNLIQIEKSLGVTLRSRGSVVTICGDPSCVGYVKNIFQYLWKKQERDIPIDHAEVRSAIRFVQEKLPQREIGLTFVTKKCKVQARTPKQAHYMRILREKTLVFSTGPAGTGKTWLAVARGVEAMINGDVERIILSRPAVEAGEKLGFLPGDMQEKVDPYLRPLYDAMHDMMPVEFIEKKLEMGDIEIAPLAFMRGRTLKNAFVILDEAQNTTEGQIKMFLTRLGEGSTMVITGDLTQVDLPKGVESGLRIAVKKLEGLEDVGTVAFDDRDVVRHDLVTKIIRAWEKS